MNSLIPEKIRQERLNNPYVVSDTSNVERFKIGPIKRNNGDVYNGEWNAQRQYDGVGLFINSKDSKVMEGVWVNGVFTKGRIYNQTGTYYEGDVKNNSPHGNGLVKYLNSTFYGKFENGKKQGEGTVEYNDGFIFKGTFDQGEAKKGILQWPEGHTFEGEISNTDKDTKGVFTVKNGDKYEGNWRQGTYHGEGVYKWANGDTYSGSYKNGLREGNGTYTFNSPDTSFTGVWQQGQASGHGSYKKQGTITTGYWRNGVKIDQSQNISEKKENLGTQNEFNTKQLQQYYLMENKVLSMKASGKYDQNILLKLFLSQYVNLNGNNSSKIPAYTEENPSITKKISKENIQVSNISQNIAGSPVKNAIDQKSVPILNGTIK